MAAPAYNEGHRASASGKIVAVAKSILSGELGIVMGARQLVPWRLDVDAENDPDFTFFVGVDSETDHLPVGEVRSRWSPDALKAKDDELRTFEAAVRDRAFRACESLIQKYGQQTG